MNVQASDTLHTLTENTLCSSTGIDEPAKPFFECHPNPFTDNLTVTFDLTWTRGSTIQLSDPTGRILEHFEVRSEQVSFSVSNLSNGIYFLTLTNPEQNRTSRKLVKQ
jgi:hypothetical protein